MHRTFATQRHLSAFLMMATAGSLAAACIPFDSEEDYYPPMASPEVVSAAKPPPAISGGTLLVSGNTAVASDPDRDLVWIVNLKDKSIAQVALSEDDEPGRVVKDNAGRVHVALRKGGDVVSIDLATTKVVDRREVCPAPRGIAYDANVDMLHVACAGGELVTLPAGGGDAVRTLRLDKDLRDVIVRNNHLLVSRFRSAELLEIDQEGVELTRTKPANFGIFEQKFEPSVAWRTVPMSNGDVAMVHQRGMATPVVIEQGGYGSGGCDNSIVHSTISMISPADQQAGMTTRAPAALSFSILPVDIAVSGDQIAVVSAGTDQVLRTNIVEQQSQTSEDPGEFGMGMCGGVSRTDNVPGGPIAVAFDSQDRMVVQTREPASLVILDEFGSNPTTISLPGVTRKDTGHEMFHTNTGGMSSLACASCHPEGHEDGRVWDFQEIGARRTQTISGGILATAPLHWDGDMEGMSTIMAEVFVKRMGGMPQGPRRINAFAKWVDALPSLPVSEPDDTTAVERGKALFHDAKVACATCHSGSKLTNNKSADVGTGKEFQVPSLTRIGTRAPFMHDGCAATLRDRFIPGCGGGDKHGVTSHLSSSQLDDLVSYLETL